VAINMQRELKRVGCFTGRIDGNWGAQSRSAVERFNEAAKLDLQSDPPAAQDVPKVKSFAGLVCEQIASPAPGTRNREPSGERRRDSGPTFSPNINIQLPIKKLF
jgi:peptidoglycan hydrolase-like protein with peptidoglycan-binding domain